MLPEAAARQRSKTRTQVGGGGVIAFRVVIRNEWAMEELLNIAEELAEKHDDLPFLGLDELAVRLSEAANSMEMHHEPS